MFYLLKRSVGWWKSLAVLSTDKAAYTNASAYTTTSRQTTPVVTPKTSYAGTYPGAAAAAATATYNTSPYAVQTTTANKGWFMPFADQFC